MSIFFFIVLAGMGCWWAYPLIVLYFVCFVILVNPYIGDRTTPKNKRETYWFQNLPLWRKIVFVFALIYVFPMPVGF